MAGALQRSLQEIAIGHVQGQTKRADLNAEMGMHEIDLQYQLPISGTAAGAPAWDEVTINFEHEFHYAPGQRDSDLEVPHFTYGAYIDRGGPVFVSACVVEYAVNEDNGGITGARVGIGVFGDATPRPFAGGLHAIFQGWAQSRDDLADNAIDT